jgi:hypothetical protein
MLSGGNHTVTGPKISIKMILRTGFIIELLDYEVASRSITLGD